MRLLACPDKFRGTATASEIARAICAAAESRGIDTLRQPLADGGEGTLDAFGGPTRTTTVTGPLGEPVEAAWRLAGEQAVVEMARASGLALAGGAEANDPLTATTRGTGELIAAAVSSGAREIIVGLGGSATTDGGLGAVEVLRAGARLRGIDIRVAADVRTRFADAPRVFGPQKGASDATISLLERRLELLVDQYQRDFGVDVSPLERAGAAGGLAGGLAVLGASLEDGFALIADVVGLDEQIADVDLVVTGEGAVDSTTWEGKVVGGVVEMARDADVPVLVVAGRVSGSVPAGVEVIDLVSLVGEAAAMSNTTASVAGVVSDFLSR